jgi:hypothetical protein
VKPDTVAALIERLKALPQDAPVAVGFDGASDLVHTVSDVEQTATGGKAIVVLWFSQGSDTHELDGDPDAAARGENWDGERWVPREA